MRKNIEELHDTLPIVSTNKQFNNEPILFKYQALSSRENLPITNDELMDFGCNILVDWYSKKGMSIIRKKNISQNYLVMEDQDGRVFYIAIKVDRYPMNPLNIDETGSEDIIKLAEVNNAQALFAPLSFSCFSNATSIHDLADKNKAIAGGVYACAFRGLINLGNY